jgi:hypothetical protein
MLDPDNQMSDELEKLRPGEAVVYFEGANLARQRVKDREDPQIAAADLAWDLALAGRVSLVQRRTDKGFEYIVIERSQPDRTPVLAHHAETAMRRTKAA